MEQKQALVHAKKVELDELKELKVKLPVRLLVNLHYVKLTQSRPISDIVKEALEEFFVRLRIDTALDERDGSASDSAPRDWLERQLQATQDAHASLA